MTRAARLLIAAALILGAVATTEILANPETWAERR
jgi:hypothetical protein